MGRRINPDNIPSWYDPYDLKALFYHEGFDDYGEPAKEMFHVSDARSARRKINHASLSHEDTIALAKGLRMSPMQYVNIFLKGVFDDE